LINKHTGWEAAAELFFEMTENRQQNHGVPPKKLILQPELICRQSSLKNKN
jgi:hypothetical protein